MSTMVIYPNSFIFINNRKYRFVSYSGGKRKYNIFRKLTLEIHHLLKEKKNREEVLYTVSENVFHLKEIKRENEIFEAQKTKCYFYLLPLCIFQIKYLLNLDII